MVPLRTARIRAAIIRKGITSERDLYDWHNSNGWHGARPSAANLRCRGGGIGSHGRLGRETTCRGGAESCVARSGPRGKPERVYRAHAVLQTEIPQSLTRSCAHAAGAKAVLG